MKKQLLFIIIILTSCLFVSKVNAASISISANKTSVTVGSTVTVTMRVSDAAGTFKMSSSNSSVLSGGGSVFLDNGSQSYTFKANKIGSANVVAAAVEATDYNTEATFSGSKSITINVVSSSSSNSKSSDNTLKSLSVEGQNISFDKNNTTYNLSVSNDVKKIKISAEASDSKATVTGTGEKDVQEGDNKFDVVVTAENGDKKTYTINVNVDSEPITVTVNGKKYTLVKNKEDLPELAIEHEDLVLNFDDQEISAYRIDTINYVLVGLRDGDGNIKLYKYDSYKDKEKPDKYTLFRQFTTPQVYISYLKFPSKLIPNDYKKYKEKINDEKVDVYKLDKDSDYCLFYGVNIETGEKNIYKYDSNEKTFQIYDKEEIKKLEKQMQEFKYIFVGLVGLCSLLLIIIVLLIFNRKRKVKKMLKKHIEKHNMVSL